MCQCDKVSRACSKSYRRLGEGLCTRPLTGGPIQRGARSGTPSAEALGTGILRSQNRGKTSTELHWQVLQTNKHKQQLDAARVRLKFESAAESSPP